MKRAVVVGAGPAGSAAAMGLLRSRGIEVVLVEREKLPRTKVCGSGLSPWTLALLDKMGVGALIRREAYRIDGAVIAGSGADDGGVELRGHHETAVLLRERFDALLAGEAVRRGAELRDGVKVDALVEHGGRAIGVQTSDGPIEADAVIDASGARGRVTRAREDRPERTLHTIMGWYEGIARQSDVVELWFDGAVKPHYGWLFPESAARANVGIVFDSAAGGPNARERFDAFLERRLSSRMRGAQQIGSLVGHPVHASTFPRRLHGTGYLVAGEAGALVDVATAEGIFHALASGLDAGGFLAKRLLESRAAPSASQLAGYDRIVQMRLGPRMAAGRGLMELLRTPVLDRALGLRNLPAMRTLLRRAFTGLYHG